MTNLILILLVLVFTTVFHIIRKSSVKSTRFTGYPPVLPPAPVPPGLQ